VYKPQPLAGRGSKREFSQSRSLGQACFVAARTEGTPVRWSVPNVASARSYSQMGALSSELSIVSDDVRLIVGWDAPHETAAA